MGDIPGRSLIALVAVLATAAALFSQPAQMPTDLRIRVSVDLVQIDVTVTGPRGEHVPGLTRDDFELFLDGHPQAITNFGHVAVPVATSAPEAPAATRRSQNQVAIPSAPAVRLRPEQVQRAVALFIDDLSLSAESVPYVRNGLRKAIESGIGPRDLTAIIRASAGMGALQDFTIDKQRLLAAADQVRWYPRGRGELAAYDRIKGPVEGNAPSSATSATYGDPEAARDSNLRNRYFQGATIDSLERVLRGMADLPGRKAVVVLSDDFRVAFRDPGSPDAQPAMHIYEPDRAITNRLRRCIDAAAHSGVVIYAIDTRGLSSLRALAADNLDHPERFSLPGKLTPDVTIGGAGAVTPQPAAHSGDFVTDAVQDRLEAHEVAEEGGFYLASATGGLMISKTNDIGASLRGIYSDLSGYYVLAFRPPDDSFERYPNGELKFHRIRVRVNRPGLQARTRAGFLGEAGSATAAPIRAKLRLEDSLSSPFGASDIGMEMHATYLQAKRDEPLIHVSLFVDPERLSLSGPEINRSAIVHLLLRAYDVHGAALEGGIDRFLRLSLNAEGYGRAMKYGLVYSTIISTGKPGPYEVRAAMLDEASGALGAANELVVIPKATAKDLAVSGILFQKWMAKEDDITPAQAASTFHPGESVPFAVEARGASNPARLRVQAALFRDGVLLGEPRDCPVEQLEKARTGGLLLRSHISVPDSAVPGDYAMELILTEQRTATATSVRHANSWAIFHVDGQNSGGAPNQRF
jgi:VWFA-related protein